jgi:N-hydroxyarylamine O-acetyltransferase
VSDLEWDLDTLDLAGYLGRVAYTGLTDPSAATLSRLHRAHVAAIPFENFDVILGRGVSVDLTNIQSKLVRSRRGGYCYEHGLLFAAVLQRFGYRVERRLARVGCDLTRPRPRTHMVLTVTANDGSRWLADVGFGSGLLEPIPLQPHAPVTQGAWTYQLARPGAGADAGLWLLQEQVDGGEWATRYSLAEERQHLADVVMSNHYTSTWPSSPFVAQPVLVRKDEHQIRSLIGRQLTHSRPGAPDAVLQLDDGGYAAAVHELGIDLNRADTDALIAHLPPADPHGRPAAEARQR